MLCRNCLDGFILAPNTPDKNPARASRSPARLTNHASSIRFGLFPCAALCSRDSNHTQAAPETAVLCLPLSHIHGSLCPPTSRLTDARTQPRTADKQARLGASRTWTALTLVSAVRIGKEPAGNQADEQQNIQEVEIAAHLISPKRFSSSATSRSAQANTSVDGSQATAAVTYSRQASLRALW